tara:strand:- start:181 stop:285 length:105 start_codon:yes stop_codon:yes gene_type:complete
MVPFFIEYIARQAMVLTVPLLAIKKGKPINSALA